MNDLRDLIFAFCDWIKDTPLVFVIFPFLFAAGAWVFSMAILELMHLTVTWSFEHSDEYMRAMKLISGICTTIVFFICACIGFKLFMDDL